MMETMAIFASKRSFSLSYRVAAARNCLRRLKTRSTRLWSLCRCALYFGGRRPREPLRARLLRTSSRSADGVRDSPGPQRTPVRLRPVCLVGVRSSSCLRGRTWPPGRVTATLSSSGTNSLVSEACPGVSRFTRLRPRPSASRCGLVVIPPRERPIPWPAGLSPLRGCRRRAGAPARRWSLRAPVEFAAGVGLCLHMVLDACPGAVLSHRVKRS
jgi:hypothetical protein